MSLTVRVIPCLDVKDGRVVKGVNFVDLVDAGDPVEQARIYDAEGADELCFLDITASHEGRDNLFDVVAKGVVKIAINQTYALADVVQAHKDLEGRKTTGSTILMP